MCFRKTLTQPTLSEAAVAPAAVRSAANEPSGQAHRDLGGPHPRSKSPPDQRCRPRVPAGSSTSTSDAAQHPSFHFTSEETEINREEVARAKSQSPRGRAGALSAPRPSLAPTLCPGTQTREAGRPWLPSPRLRPRKVVTHLTSV